jgi:hypothetical protein
MRRITLFVTVLALAGLSCGVPSSATINAAQNFVKGALTNLPGTVQSESTKLAPTLNAQVTKLGPTIKAGETALAGNPEGTITGTLNFPGGTIPAERVVAFDAASKVSVAEITTLPGQSQYGLSVPTGEYFIVAYSLDGKRSGGYTQAVKCGLLASCKDHQLIPVSVANKGTTGNINPQDWNAPAGAFPPMP